MAGRSTVQRRTCGKSDTVSWVPPSADQSRYQDRPRLPSSRSEPLRCRGPTGGGPRALEFYDAPHVALQFHRWATPFATHRGKYWDEIAKDIRPVYTAPSEAVAKERFTAHWGAQSTAISRFWENASSEFVPFLDHTTSRSDASSAPRTPSNP